MNPCGKGERNKHLVSSTGLPHSFHQLKASHTEQNGSEEKSIRVKRRRTRRERNYVKFGRNGTDSVLEHRPGCRGLQKVLPPFWSSQLSNCAQAASFKGIPGAKPVIITQHRLSQHFGMFNKEVKSVNIERLLSPRCEQEFLEMTPLQRDSGADMQLGEESQAGKSGGPDQKSVPCEQLGSSVNNPCGMNEDSLPVVVPVVSATGTGHHSGASVHTVQAGSQSSAAPTAAEVDQQSEVQTAEADPGQSNTPLVSDEKENNPPVSPSGAESHKGKSLARELALDLQKLLDLKAIFPGRNLINETRQTILGALLKQKQKLPDFSALVLQKKLAGGSKSDAVQPDFKSLAGRDQELLLESKSSGGSRNSDQGVSLKKRRGQDLFFLTSPASSLAHTAGRMDEGRPPLREDMDCFVEPEGFNQQSFCLAALQPHSRLTSRHVHSAAECSLASEEHCPLQEPLLRTPWPWEKGLKDTLLEPRCRRGRAKVACRQLQKTSAPQKHHLPFRTWGSWNFVTVNTNDNCSSMLPVGDSQQYSYVNELRSDRWSLQGAEPTAGLSQEHCGSQNHSVRLRSTERAANESQTSFDVLKSIWSPNVCSNGARFPMPRSLGYPFIDHQPSLLRELNSEQEEFLQLHSIAPEQHCSSYRQNSQPEIRVPSRHPQNGYRVFSAPAKPRTHCQKVALERGRTSYNYQLWEPTGASARRQGTREKGCLSSWNPACSQERLSQMESLQQLRLIQQLPMSYFPPSEVLENKHSPLHSLQDHLLGQSSPEPWAFPRMKLY